MTSLIGSFVLVDSFSVRQNKKRDLKGHRYLAIVTGERVQGRPDVFQVQLAGQRLVLIHRANFVLAPQ